MKSLRTRWRLADALESAAKRIRPKKRRQVIDRRTVGLTGGRLAAKWIEIEGDTVVEHYRFEPVP